MMRYKPAQAHVCITRNIRNVDQALHSACLAISILPSAHRVVRLKARTRTRCPEINFL